MTSNRKNDELTEPILGYWKIRGLASGIRYQLVFSDISFREETYEQGDAPDFSRASWTDVKYNQNLEFPNLPYLKDGEFSLTETAAIHRYCAKKWCPELLCLDDIELYGKAEMMWGVMTDLKMLVTVDCYRGNGDKKALTETILPQLENIAKVLTERKFLVGDRLCCADFQFAELIEMVDFISEGKVFKDYPSLKGYRDHFFDLPKIKEYYANIEKCPNLPFNNKIAKINN